MSVALVHDYLTQRGGAERVVASMLRAFPDAPVYTSLYAAEATFPEFREADIRASVLDRLPPLRADHRRALPLLAPVFSAMRVNTDVAICSSSGWAHGASVTGRKIVYCHNPARWLYQTAEYAGSSRGQRAIVASLRAPLIRWDRRAARSADTYVVNSSVVQERVRVAYGIDAEVLAPPPAIVPDGPETTVAGVTPGFVLCVARLLPYKNVDAVIDACRGIDASLVVVGRGPLEGHLRESAPSNVTLLTGGVDDAELRWLYRNCIGLVAASYEDFGLTPLEAASFGKPVAALRAGGYLDTVVEGTTGVFFDSPTASEIASAIDDLRVTPWSTRDLIEHAERFSESRFLDRIRSLVASKSELGA